MADIRSWIKEADEARVLRRIKEETDLRRVPGILNEDRNRPVRARDVVSKEHGVVASILGAYSLDLVLEPVARARARERIAQSHRERALARASDTNAIQVISVPL